METPHLQRGASNFYPNRSDAKGFEVLPKRWIVERTFAWISHNRRLARDFERYASTVAASRLLVRSPYGFSFLSRSPVRRLLVEPATTHLSEYTFALHLALQNSKCLLDVVVSHEYLHALLPRLWTQTIEVSTSGAIVQRSGKS
jgi:hypothetical protein